MKKEKIGKILKKNILKKEEKRLNSIKQKILVAIKKEIIDGCVCYDKKFKISKTYEIERYKEISPSDFIVAIKELGFIIEGKMENDIIEFKFPTDDKDIDSAAYKLAIEIASELDKMFSDDEERAKDTWNTIISKIEKDEYDYYITRDENYIVVKMFLNEKIVDTEHYREYLEKICKKNAIDSLDIYVLEEWAEFKLCIHL